MKSGSRMGAWGASCAMAALLSGCAAMVDPFSQTTGAPPAASSAPSAAPQAAASGASPEQAAAAGALAAAATGTGLAAAPEAEQKGRFSSILGTVKEWITGEKETSRPAMIRLSPASGIAYDARIEGLDAENKDDALIIGLIESAARLYRMKDKPPASVPLLKRRAEADRDIVERVLKSEGYYEGKAKVAVQEPPEGVEGAKPVATITVEKGPRYLIESHQFAFDPALPPEEETAALAKAQDHIGGPARGEAVVGAESKVVTHLNDNGRIWAERKEREAEADWDTDRLRVATQVAPGPFAVYGETTVEGEQTVEEDYILGFPTWAKGEPVSRAELTAVQRELAGSRLFKAVTVKAPEAPPEGADPVVAPIEITVEEAKHRTIGGGLKYSTVAGPGGRIFWEHRNMFGRGERFRVGADAALARQSLDLSFAKPRFGHPKRTLSANLSAYHESTDAYEAYGAEGGVGLDQILTEHWRGSAGLTFEAARIDRAANGVTLSFLVGAPLTASFDSTDDLLDPTRGARFSLGVTPWGGVYDNNPTGFAVMDASGSAYYAIDEDKRYVVAGRLRAAAIAAAGPDKVPPTKRLYMGGGGSLRGYALKFAGPLDIADKPIGGLTLAEGALELRAKVTEKIGVVPFLEAGVVGTDFLKGFDAVRFSGGLGLRYYSPVGPIRLDVAVPLNKRDQDDWWQLYFSIGQAF